MSQQLVLYTEPLTDNEVSFLRHKLTGDRKQYYRVYRLLMIMSFIIPFAGAWYRAMDNAPNAFSMVRFFAGVGVLLSISTLAVYISYSINHKKIQVDLRHNTKTIEVSHILRKQFMPQTGTYFFYITSPNRLSIEVSQADWHRLEIGDEVSIEYTTASHLYLGYF